MANDFDDFPENPTAQPPTHPAKVDLGSVDDLMTVGVPAAKFENPGDTVRGVVVSVTVAQQRDFRTKSPLFWDDGNPRTQALIVLQTAERSADIDDDDGKRQLYVKRPSALLKAIIGALGATKFSQSIGGTLAVKYTGNGEPAERGISPPKLYAAKFTPAGGTDAAPGPQPAFQGVTANPRQQPAAVDVPTAKAHAWEDFKAKTPGITADQRKAAWFGVLAEYAEGTDPANLSAAEWHSIAKKIREEYGNPPGGPGMPPEDDSIPFAPCVV